MLEGVGGFVEAGSMTWPSDMTMGVTDRNINATEIES